MNRISFLFKYKKLGGIFINNSRGFDHYYIDGYNIFTDKVQMRFGSNGYVSGYVIWTREKYFQMYKDNIGK